MATEPPRRSGLVGQTAGFNIVRSLVAALTGILLARWLGPADRGNYAAVTAFFGLIILATELGIGSAVVYYVARRKSEADNFVRTATAMLVPLSLIGAAATFGIALLFLDSGDPRRIPLLVLTVCIVVSLAGTPRNFVLQAISIPRWNVVRLSQPVIMMVLVVGTEIVGPIDVTTVIALMAVSLAVQSALGWYFYAKVSNGQGTITTSVIRPVLRFGLTNMVSTAPNALNARVDQVVLALVVAPALLGQYAVAVTLSLLAGPLALAFGYVAFPRLARGDELREAIIARAVRGSLLVSLLGIAIIAASAPFAVPIVFGDGYGDVPRLLFVLAPGAVAFVVNQVIGDLLRGLGRPGLVARCEWFGLIATLAGLIVLVPAFGPYGAAFTSSVVYLIVHVLLRWCLRSARSELNRNVAGKDPATQA